MKALSLKQPWAWALFAGKDIENRSWSTSFRGKFLVHASKSWDEDGYCWLRSHVHLLHSTGIFILPDKSEFEMGGIVGVAELVDCVVSSDSPWFEDRYGFVIENAKPLSFTPCKGRLNFFEVENAIVQRYAGRL